MWYTRLKYNFRVDWRYCLKLKIELFHNTFWLFKSKCMYFIIYSFYCRITFDSTGATDDISRYVWYTRPKCDLRINWRNCLKFNVQIYGYVICVNDSAPIIYSMHFLCVVRLELYYKWKRSALQTIGSLSEIIIRVFNLFVFVIS